MRFRMSALTAKLIGRLTQKSRQIKRNKQRGLWPAIPESGGEKV